MGLTQSVGEEKRDLENKLFMVHREIDALQRKAQQEQYDSGYSYPKSAIALPSALLSRLNEITKRLSELSGLSGGRKKRRHGRRRY
jgi:hypothetical protein